jgi:hypothetical protein
MNAHTDRLALAAILTATGLFAVAPRLAAQNDDWRDRRNQPPTAVEQQPPADDESNGKRVGPVPERVGPVYPDRPGPLGGRVDVRVWTDRGERASYCAGEGIEIYFTTNVDAYVTIYDIDTRGEVSVLFPGPYGRRDNLVEGGRTYRVSPGWGTRLAVTGPQGWEEIRAVAVAADWGRDSRDRDGRYRDDYDGRYRDDDSWNDGWKSRRGVDPGDFDRELGKRVVPVPVDDRDIDQTAFYVESGRECGYGGRSRWHFSWSN